MVSAGVWSEMNPPYGSAFFFELHETETGQYVVQMYYKNDTVMDTSTPPIPIMLPGKLMVLSPDSLLYRFRPTIIMITLPVL